MNETVFPCPTCTGETGWEGEPCGGCSDEMDPARLAAFTRKALANAAGRAAHPEMCPRCGGPAGWAAVWGEERRVLACLAWQFCGRVWSDPTV